MTCLWQHWPCWFLVGGFRNKHQSKMSVWTVPRHCTWLKGKRRKQQQCARRHTRNVYLAFALTTLMFRNNARRHEFLKKAGILLKQCRLPKNKLSLLPIWSNNCQTNRIWVFRHLSTFSFPLTFLWRCHFAGSWFCECGVLLTPDAMLIPQTIWISSMLTVSKHFVWDD